MDADFVVRYQYAKDCFQDSTIEEIIQYTGFDREKNYIFFDFLGGRFVVDHPSAQFYTFSGKPIDFEIFTEIVLLDYMANKSDVALLDKPVAYDDFVEDYGQVHKLKMITPWLNWFPRYFMENPHKLAGIADTLGGTWTDEKDKLTLSLPIFPRIPITLIGWKNENPYNVKGQIIYDESVKQLLRTESCAALARVIIDRIKTIEGQLYV